MEDKVTYSYCYDDKFQIEDLEERRLYLNGEINETTIDSIVYHIMRFNRLDKGIIKEERKPIMLYINSPGGNVVEGYGVIDSILLSDTPVYTVNVAQAASMGFLIFLSGHKRFAFPHSEFLMHDENGLCCDSTAKLKDRMEFETIQLEGMTKEYIISRTKIDDDLYKTKYRCEWYFLPEEGKKIGVVDYIVGEDCSFDNVL